MLRRPGSSWGFGALLKGLTSVVVLKVERVLVIHSPTYNPCRTWDSNPQPSGYKSDSLFRWYLWLVTIKGYYYYYYYYYPLGHDWKKPLLKMMHKKARKQFAEDKQPKDMDYWNQFRWCQVCVAATRWGVQRQVCLAYSQAWWWECHGLGLHECCQHWGATVHRGNHACQHVLWHTEAEHDPLPSETGPQGSIPTW